MSDQTKFMVIGGLIGAALGVTAAWAYTNNRSGKLAQPLGAGQQSLRLHAGAPDFVKVGMATLALVRQVTELFKPA